MKQMPWLRLYLETPQDLKLRLVARKSRQEVARVLAVWVMMLCHAGGRHDRERGTLAGWDDELAGVGLDLDAEVVAVIREAMEGHMIQAGKIVAWDRRQESESTERVRKHRALKAGEASAGRALQAAASRAETAAERDETTGTNQEHAKRDETAMKRGVTDETLEERRGEERREESSSSSESFPGRAAGADAPDSSGEDAAATARRSRKAPSIVVTLPDWLPQAAWDDWCQHRRGKNWTQRGAELSIVKLATLREEGNDPKAVIEQSIAAGWSGLFAEKSRAGPPGSSASRPRSAISQWDDLLGEGERPRYDLEGTSEETPH